ncbi:hypothetical protein ALO68_200017 [Pseudomonas syringae pv. helianthi]|uniref:Uncharacterized protein n=2 Tax=Pseudomonas syringae group TaxID=136849 RepID=A0A0N8RQ70_9PSED|nr:hypothetical protein ALO68_200017 [Pseudomonas syringae pv. helianthi]KPX58900.1 hypothetical protein ALO67_200065 [Pseudomonas amygdali pv. hibisci]RMN54927.1 hypothetical protein ALQ57_200079 [Pseudomonas amygdali pv. hibisci]RMR09657.1 hypothetical protein ALP93_200022 [Pseudomonas syringae pv. helianthi]
MRSPEVSCGNWVIHTTIYDRSYIRAFILIHMHILCIKHINKLFTASHKQQNTYQKCIR